MASPLSGLCASLQSTADPSPSSSRILCSSVVHLPSSPSPAEGEAEGEAEATGAGAQGKEGAAAWQLALTGLKAGCADACESVWWHGRWPLDDLPSLTKTQSQEAALRYVVSAFGAAQLCLVGRVAQDSDQIAVRLFPKAKGPKLLLRRVSGGEAPAFSPHDVLADVVRARNRDHARLATCSARLATAESELASAKTQLTSKIKELASLQRAADRLRRDNARLEAAAALHHAGRRVPSKRPARSSGDSSPSSANDDGGGGGGGGSGAVASKRRDQGNGPAAGTSRRPVQMQGGEVRVNLANPTRGLRRKDSGNFVDSDTDL